jgi:hypothetical protein
MSPSACAGPRPLDDHDVARVIDLLAKCERTLRPLGRSELADWLAERRDALRYGSRSQADVFAELCTVDLDIQSPPDPKASELDARLRLALFADVLHQLTQACRDAIRCSAPCPNPAGCRRWS